MDYTLLAIVDAGIVPQEELEERILAATRGGATWLQIRAKALAARDFIGYSRDAGRAANHAGLPFLVNDRVDVAMLVGADGVHLGAGDMPVRKARALLGKKAIIGATARDPETARRAEMEGATYLGVGPQFASPTKPDLVPLPEGRVGEIREATSLPLVGIGGIDPSNTARAAARGLDGVAVISSLWSGDSEEKARELVREFQTGRFSS